MRTNAKSLLLLIVAVFLTACGGSPQKNNLENAPVVASRTLIDGEGLIELNPSLLKDTVVFPLSYFTEELQIVRLDNRDEALVNSSSAYVSDNYFLTIGSQPVPFKLFDKQGRYLTDIGTYGQGPGEYQFVYSGSIDEENQRVYIMPFAAESLLVYDLEGNVLPPVPLVYKGLIATFTVLGDKLLVMATPHPKSPTCVWLQDMNGNLLYDIPTPDLDIEWRGTNVNSYRNEDHIDLSYWSVKAQVDTLYQIDLDKRKLIPRFTANFKGDALKRHLYAEWPGYYLGSTSSVVTVVKRDEDGKEYLGQEGEMPAYYMVDKETLRGAYLVLVDDFFGGIRFDNPLLFHNKYYVTCMDPGDLAERIDKALQSDQLSGKMRKRLTDIQTKMTDDDNNYLLYAKLKGVE